MADILNLIRKTAKITIRVESSQGESRKVKTLTKTKQNITKFTDLNLDCLEKIFGYLNLRDLLNAADSSADFKNALRPVFVIMYHSKLVTIEKMRQSSRQSITIDRDGILIEDIETCFQFLRCFGDLISKLKLSHWPAAAGDSLRNQLGRVINLISENCGENLKEITILNVQWIIWLDMKKRIKPFWNVQNVHIEGSMIKEGMLNRLFPKMESLTYAVDEYHEQFKCIIGHFHHLKHLEVNVGARISRDRLSKCYMQSVDCIQRCIELNCQITSLKVNSQYMSILELFSRNLPKVECLSLQYDVRLYRDCPIHLDEINNTDFSVRFVSSMNSGNQTFLLECDNIEKITAGKSHVISLEKLLETLNENGLMRKLTVNSTNRISAENCNKLTKEEFEVIELLTSLLEIELIHCSVTADQVISIITRADQLNRFSFDISTEEYSKLSNYPNLKCQFRRKTLTNESQFVTVELSRL